MKTNRKQDVDRYIAEVRPLIEIKDYESACVKMRKIVEIMAQELVDRNGLVRYRNGNIYDTIIILEKEHVIDSFTSGNFHKIRMTGDQGAHTGNGKLENKEETEALFDALKAEYEKIWSEEETHTYTDMIPSPDFDSEQYYGQRGKWCRENESLPQAYLIMQDSYWKMVQDMKNGNMKSAVMCVVGFLPQDFKYYNSGYKILQDNRYYDEGISLIQKIMEENNNALIKGYIPPLFLDVIKHLLFGDLDNSYSGDGTPQPFYWGIHKKDNWHRYTCNAVKAIELCNYLLPFYKEEQKKGFAIEIQYHNEKTYEDILWLKRLAEYKYLYLNEYPQPYETDHEAYHIDKRITQFELFSEDYEETRTYLEQHAKLQQKKQLELIQNSLEGPIKNILYRDLNLFLQEQIVTFFTNNCRGLADVRSGKISAYIYDLKAERSGHISAKGIIQIPVSHKNTRNNPSQDFFFSIRALVYGTENLMIEADIYMDRCLFFRFRNKNNEYTPFYESALRHIKIISGNP